MNLLLRILLISLAVTIVPVAVLLTVIAWLYVVFKLTEKMLDWFDDRWGF